MPRPSLFSRTKDRHGGVGLGILARLEIEFPQLTGITAQCQVCQSGQSTGTFGDDVIETQAMREKTFRGMTVFTTVARTPGDT
jgi:hypothetical protein